MTHNTQVSIKPTDDQLRLWYLTECMSTSEIAARCGVSARTVNRWLTALGIELRSRSEARLNAIRQGKLPHHAATEINPSFFGRWSEAMAWTLGLLFTDGVFYDTHNRHRVVLALIERGTLEKVKAAMSFTGEIREKAQGYDPSKKIWVLAFGREEIYRDLRRLGLKPRKSLDMAFPDMPPEFVRHFIRGCWDGDGGFTLGGKNSAPAAHYTCGSYAFISRLVEQLAKIGIRTAKTNEPISIYKRKNANAYDLRISYHDNLVRLYKFMYADLTTNCFMDVKRDKLRTIIGDAAASKISTIAPHRFSWQKKRPSPRFTLRKSVDQKGE